MASTQIPSHMVPLFPSLLGYKDDMHEVFNGQIGGARASLDDSGSVYTVTAFSYLHQLNHTTRYHAFENLTPSQAIERILSEYGLEANCESFGSAKEQWPEEEMTDWEFILLQAERYGKDIYCFGKKVYIKEIMDMHREEIIFEREKSLISYDVRMSFEHQASKAQVIGHDKLTGESFVGECSLSEVTPKTGGDKDMTYLSKQSGGAPIVHTHVYTEAKDIAEAKEISAAFMRRESFKFIHANGKGEGTPKLAAGALVTIKGMSPGHAGEFIANEVEHELSVRNGYFTRFHLKRNMVDEETVRVMNPGALRIHTPPQSSLSVAENNEAHPQEEKAEALSEFRSLKWKNGSKEINEALVDDEVTLYCEVKNIPDGETVKFSIFEQGESKDDPIGELEGTVKNGTVEVPWKVVCKGGEGSNCAQELEEQGWTVPDYFFAAEYGGVESHQGKVLEVRGWIKRQIKDKDSNEIVASRKYTLLKPNGTRIEGITDKDGYVDTVVEIAKDGYFIFLHEELEYPDDKARNSLKNFMEKLLEKNDLEVAKNHKIPMCRLAEWLEEHNVCALNDDIEVVLLHDKIAIPENRNALLKIITDSIPALENGVSNITVGFKDIFLSLFVVMIIYGIIIRRNANIAREEAIRFYENDGLHGGRGDAFRHALWCALNSQEINTRVARLVGDAWEFDTNPTSFTQAGVHMDIHNNEVGIEIGGGNRRADLQALTKRIQKAIQPRPPSKELGDLLMMRRREGESGDTAFYNQLFRTNDRNYQTVIGFNDSFIKRGRAAQRIVNIIKGEPNLPNEVWVAEKVRIVGINEIVT